MSSTCNCNSQISLKQALQTEQLFSEVYKKQMGVYNDWPGFDLVPVQESFWDNNYSPNSDSWADKPGLEHLNVDLQETLNPPANISPANIWEQSLSSATWEPETISWSPCDNCYFIGINGMSNDVIMTSENLLIENKPSIAGEFDPFNTPCALWMSQLTKKKISTPLQIQVHGLLVYSLTHLKF